ncbi:MAG: hypothetical protein K9L74_00695 [Candidatus Izimaplasma sp.]|nr:hypothetical protein [Candidatus Izimaplasma bacterium]
MNSTFKNSPLGFYLYAFIITIMLIATAFIIWYMFAGYRLGTYPEDTRLGSVYIGGLHEEEVKTKVRDRIDFWLQDETVQFELEYQDYTYSFDRGLFYFDLDLSISRIEDGQTNPIIVAYQGTDRQLVLDEMQNLEFLEDINNNIDFERLINDIREDAQMMKIYSNKDIEDYIINMDREIEELGYTRVRLPDGLTSDELIDGIKNIYEVNRIPISGQTMFDVVNKLSPQLDDNELTLLSQGLLELITKETNFIINERHYIPEIDFSRYNATNYPLLGKNVTVNQITGDSFSFYNPNESEYYFKLIKESDSVIKLTLHGLPFKYDIQTTIQKTELPYITEVTNTATDVRNGYNGVVIEVIRTITDIDGEIVQNKIIVFEFYPPQKEIIYE